LLASLAACRSALGDHEAEAALARGRALDIAGGEALALAICGA
jgi:hypothetical protein